MVVTSFNILTFILGSTIGGILAYKVLGKVSKKGTSYLLSIKPSTECIKCFKMRKACDEEQCNYLKFRKVINILKSAVDSIDICVALITSRLILDNLLFLKAKGVNIRIIVDSDLCKDGTNATRFLECIKHAKIPYVAIENYLMHHKFAIVDSKYCIIGSMNWTNSGFSRNYEQAEITNDRATVAAFSKEFQKLWIRLSKNVD